MEGVSYQFTQAKWTSKARLLVWRCPSGKQEKATDPESGKKAGLDCTSGDLGSRLM